MRMERKYLKRTIQLTGDLVYCTVVNIFYVIVDIFQVKGF